MKKIVLAVLAALALAPVAPAAAQSGDARQIAGIWRNPKNTVHVNIQPCGSSVCGTVSWANAQAISAARDAGTPNLIGTQLFRQFRSEGSGTWGGRVFVPDMNRTFSGSIRLAGAGQVEVRGCLIGRFLCKSQTWVRVR